jgi:predicted MPP superfamily phosphohydrolase
MIRVLYMSDLHLEMERWRLPLPGWPAFLARHKALAAHPARGPMLDDLGDIDLAVLAGDIHGGLRGIVYADQLAKYLRAPVVFVAGNHEYYRHNMARLLPAFRNAAAHTEGRVHFLENAAAAFTIRGRRLNVLGCTLWTDYELHGRAFTGMLEAERCMNDHVFIQHAGGAFRPEDALARHRESRIWLHKTLAGLRRTEPQSQNLIVTHHAPSAAFLGTRTGAVAPAYGSEMLAEFAHLKPAAWFHGHTHYRHETLAEGIRLASAPRGYLAFELEALEFRPGVMEV